VDSSPHEGRLNWQEAIMAGKANSRGNEFRCSIETNQTGKYCVRIRARFQRTNWVLSTYFLASTFSRAVQKLEESLQFLQRHEDRLWFWGVDRSDDPGFAGELLAEAGLKVDRRAEFPRRTASVVATPGKPIPAFVIAPLRRGLADVTALQRAAVASD
jgi:hypothetical protein